MTLIEAALPDHRLISLLIPEHWTDFTYQGQRFRRSPDKLLIQQHYGGQWRSVAVLARDVVVLAEQAA